MSEKYGLDEEIKEDTVIEETPSKKAQFAVWSVGGRDYRLKLSGRAICTLERKFGRNLLMVIADEGMPPLETMLIMIQSGLEAYNHGMNFNRVLSLYDQYCEDGGDQPHLMSDVITPLMQVSGFFTAEQAEDMAAEIQA